MNNFFINNIGDLIETQRVSFYKLLQNGINNEFINFKNPFTSEIYLSYINNNIISLVYLYINNIKINGPLYTLDICFLYNLNYTIQIYIPGEYSYVLPKRIENNIISFRFKQDFLLGEIPLMTEEGTFILNGCERIVINQLIRNPGIYFNRIVNKISLKPIYSATIISTTGLWTQIILEDALETQNDLYILLDNFKNISKKNLKINNNINKLYLIDFIKYFGFFFHEIEDNLNLDKSILNTFLKGNCLNSNYNLNNKKINLDLIFKSYNILNPLYIGKIGRNNFNKRLNLSISKNLEIITGYDFLKIIEELLNLKYNNYILDDIDDLKNKYLLSIGNLLQNKIRNYICNFDLKNFNDIIINNENNILLLKPEKFTQNINDFFITSELSQFLDQTNPLSELTHKRKVSYFGPNGLNRDHVSMHIRDIHSSQYGRLCPIETPEGQNAGLINTLSLHARVNSLGEVETPYFFVKDENIFNKKKPLYLTAKQDSVLEVCYNEINLKNISFISNSVKYQLTFNIKKLNFVNFIVISSLQIISLATGLIPFLEHNDTNRTLMGSNMQRQAIPLLFTQKPIVGTGLETIAILDSGLIVKSYTEGIVKYVSSVSIQIEDKFFQKITYFLRKYNKSNQKTSINQQPIIWVGEYIYSNQIIADGAGTNDGELSLGKNLLIAYMPWEGYNYEDAILINERLIIEDILTSIYIEEIKIPLSTNNGILSNKIINSPKVLLNNLSLEGIIKIGSYIKKNDILIGKIKNLLTINKKDELNTLKKYITNINNNYKNISIYNLENIKGRVIDICITNKDNNEENIDFLSIYIAQIKKIQIGDKLSGRHGNKGIIARILSSEDMPYLPNGVPIDIILNPLGVPSRMNIGQILEGLLGFVGNNLGYRYKILPFDEIYSLNASRILINQKLKEVSYKLKQNWIYNSYLPGKILLKDGRTGETFDNPITICKSYILKLIHVVENKIHSRAIGPYNIITEQPVAGKAQKGGQRFGEMEVWALEAYGCSNTLQELLTIKSDNQQIRVELYNSLIFKKNLPVSFSSDSFLTLIRELNALGLNFSCKNINSGFNSTLNLKIKEKDLFKNLESRLKLKTLIINS